jgi:nucleotide-binding universal stress UspA family protein
MRNRFGMTQSHIVVGIDGSDSSWRALEWAADEAERTKRSVIVAHAGDSSPVEDDPKSFGTELLEDAVAQLAESHPAVIARTLLAERDPAELLLELASQADLVVLGRGRHFLPLMRLGSVTDKVLAEAPCPTVVIDGSQPQPSSTIVVGISDSAGGMAALHFACNEAQRRGADVVAVRSWVAREYQLAASAALPITSPDIWESSERAIAEQCVSKVQDEYPTVTIRTVVTGASVEVALEEEVKDAAMLVLGCRRGDDGVLPRLGPVTSWAVHHCARPVVVVGHPAREESVRPADQHDAAFS